MTYRQPNYDPYDDPWADDELNHNAPQGSCQGPPFNPRMNGMPMNQQFLGPQGPCQGAPFQNPQMNGMPMNQQFLGPQGPCQGAPFQNPQANGMPMNQQFPTMNGMTGMTGMTSNHSQGFPVPQPTMDAMSQGVQGYGTGMASNHSQGFPGANQPQMPQGQPGQPSQPPNYMMNSPPPNVAVGQPQNQPQMPQGQPGQPSQPPNYMMNSGMVPPSQPSQPSQAQGFMGPGQQIPQAQAPHGHHGRWGRAAMNSTMPQSQSQGFPCQGLQGQQMNGSDYRGTSVGAPPAAQTSRPPSQAGPPQFGSVKSSMSRVCLNQGPTPEGFKPKGGTSQVSGISGRSAPLPRDTVGNQERPASGPAGVPTGSACNGTTPPAKPQARLPEDDSDSDDFHLDIYDVTLVRKDPTKKWGLSMKNPGPRASGVLVSEVREATPAHEWNCEVPLKPWRIKKEDVLLAVNSEVVDVANYKHCLEQAGLYAELLFMRPRPEKPLAPVDPAQR